MKLFAYELKKISGNRFLIALTVIFLCINALVLLTFDDDNTDIPWDDKKSFIAQYALHTEKMDAEYQSILEWDETQELRWSEEMQKGNYYWEPEAKPSLYAKEGYTDRRYFEWWQSKRYKNRLFSALVSDSR